MSGRRGNNTTTNGGAASRSSTTMNGSRASTRSNRSRRSTPQDTFHPKLITAQIVSMQCFHYFLLGFLFQVNYVLYNKSITVDRIFTDKYVRLWHTSGWADVSAIVLANLVGYVLMMIQSYPVFEKVCFVAKMICVPHTESHRNCIMTGLYSWQSLLKKVKSVLISRLHCFCYIWS